MAAPSVEPRTRPVRSRGGADGASTAAAGCRPPAVETPSGLSTATSLVSDTSSSSTPSARSPAHPRPSRVRQFGTRRPAASNRLRPCVAAGAGGRGARGRPLAAAVGGAPRRRVRPLPVPL
eukprot:TRINITY_DN5614_c1_g1_i1.p3 TRINITY_DN5614_c1_g1~~TRINITY_DN5614_c1_g1_i1.p3  ORF type:complete len:140 (+),score=19.98 TRINITY_DN5614_c1_g1_i1:58-420(+)